MIRQGASAADGGRWLAVCLATVAGYVDAYGFITFMTFVSFMSGNTTHAGYHIGEGALAAAVPALLAIVSFVSGVFAGTFVSAPGGPLPRRAVFGAIAALLLLYIICTRAGVLSGHLSIVTLSFTMGIMNTVLSRVGSQSVNLTFVTGTLSHIGAHLAHAFRRDPLPGSGGPGDTHFGRAMLLTAVWLGFVTGAILSGAATPRFGADALFPPLVVMLALAVLTRGRAGA